MTTIEIKMHYTVTSIFKFTKVAINKYLLLPIILFFYALFSISNVILFSHNFLVNIVVIFILAKIASYIDSFIIAIVINKMLKNNHLIGYFGNPVLVGNGLNADVLMPGARNFDIIYKDLNKKQCIGLASFKFSSQFWLGVTGITIINDDNKQFFTWDDKENSLPIQKNTAKDICDAKNTIIWHYEQ